MRQQKRVLAVCNDLGKCETILKKCGILLKEKKMGFTLMFVHESSLFSLPFFTPGEGIDRVALKKQLKEKVESVGLEDAAILVYEGDTPDRVAREVEREEDLLVVMTYEPNVTPQVIEKLKCPVLILKETKLHYTKAVIAIDAIMPDGCLDVMKYFFPQTKIHLYQDFHYIPTPSIDPLIEPLDTSVDMSAYSELMKTRKEIFESFCKEAQIAGTFEVGEGSIEEDTVAFAHKEGADLLVIAPLDKKTLLGDVIEDILQSVEVDLLICFEGRFL